LRCFELPYDELFAVVSWFLPLRKVLVDEIISGALKFACNGGYLLDRGSPGCLDSGGVVQQPEVEGFIIGTDDAESASQATGSEPTKCGHSLSPLLNSEDEQERAAGGGSGFDSDELHRGALSTLYDQYMPSVVPPRSRDQTALRRPAAPPEYGWIGHESSSGFSVFGHCATYTGSFCVFGPVLSSPAHASISLAMPQIEIEIF
jgi:hypothetical protein